MTRSVEVHPLIKVGNIAATKTDTPDRQILRIILLQEAAGHGVISK
jgi:hypothetical protein